MLEQGMGREGGWGARNGGWRRRKGNAGAGNEARGVDGTHGMKDGGGRGGMLKQGMGRGGVDGAHGMEHGGGRRGMLGQGMEWVGWMGRTEWSMEEGKGRRVENGGREWKGTGGVGKPGRCAAPGPHRCHSGCDPGHRERWGTHPSGVRRFSPDPWISYPARTEQANRGCLRLTVPAPLRPSQADG